MLNPGAQARTMAPMDPESYSRWYENWMQTFGAMMPGAGGDTAEQ
jgi:hypothetical protein